MTPTWGRIDKAGTWHVADATKVRPNQVSRTTLHHGQITLDDCRRQKADIRRRYRRDRLRRGKVGNLGGERSSFTPRGEAPFTLKRTILKFHALSAREGAASRYAA